MSKTDCTTFCVYRIVCFTTALVYVGQTLDFNLRKRRHLAALNKGNHKNRQLQRDFSQYGANVFYFEILEKGILKSEIDRRERYWIAYFDSYHNGYNRTIGGSVIQLHGNIIPCTWNGIVYQSITDAARANRLTHDTLAARIKAGYKSDADMLKTHSKECEWNGIKYRSISDAAKANNINGTTLLERLEKGYLCDADMAHPHLARCTWNNIDYPSYTAAAKANGVSTHTIRWRILQGYTCDDDMK